MKISKKIALLALSLTCFCSLTAGVARSTLSFAQASGPQAVACKHCGKGNKLQLNKKSIDDKKKHVLEWIA